ncbi:MAG: cation-translocating P-type ATPase [Vicinamibacterales bacterium]
MSQHSIPVPPGLDGLSSDDARHRLRVHGPNRWVAPDPFAQLRELVATLSDPMAVMLAVAAGLYWLAGETRDAVVLALALIPVLGVDVLLEARSRAALKKLAAAAAPVASVVRDGRVTEVALEDVVPGDLLVLLDGHVAAADGTVVWAANLAMDESSLTGESEPQPKHPQPPAATEDGDPGRSPAPDARFHAGALTVTGQGFGRVTATGPGTAYGHIAALVTETTPPASPLQRHAAALVRRLGALALVLAAALAGVAVLQGASWSEALLGGVSFGMAAIPEEFPLVLTIFLSAGAWRLAQHGLLVRRLASVETLGATTVICTDKTGTLTRGTFDAAEHRILQPGLSETAFLEAALLACERSPADPMEQALERYARVRGVAHETVVARHTLVRDYDFDPVGKHMSHVWLNGSGGDGAGAGGDAADRGIVVAAKGAVEGVLAHVAAGDPSRAALIAANADMAARGLRVLAIAGRRGGKAGATRDDDERDLVIQGLVGFQDPIRPEVPPAVAECQRAGIAVKMITGDHALTAHAVAEAAGILHDDDLIVTGDDLEALDADARRARIRAGAIFARVSPQQKFLIVDTLRQLGAVVAMTGDGVNDAPALRRADIGIAMGRRGTDVARATADLVLLDDNFASLVATVREGRHLHQNIQRAFLYLVAFHVPIVALAVLAPLAGVPLLLHPIHMVWLELIVHPVSALIFQADPVTDAVMQRPPRDPQTPLLPRSALWRSVAAGALLSATTFGIYAWELEAGTEAAARGLALLALLAGYQTLVFVERRALPGLGVAALPRSGLFWSVWLGATLSLVVVLAVPALASLFRVVPVPPAQLALAVAAGVAAVAWRFVLPARPR